MITRGWIALHRSIIDHWVWNTSSKRLQRWIDLIFLASWQPEKEVFFGNGLVKLKRGQYATSTRRLMQRWHTNNHIVSDTLKLFESAGMISIDRKRNWMVITVCNYEKYQFAALKAQSMLENNEEYDNQMSMIKDHNLSPSLHQGMQESEDVQLQNQLPNKEDNNINNQQDKFFLIAREENLRYAEELKNNPLLIESAMRSLQCEKEQVIELIDAYLNDMVFIGKRHSDIRDFNSHFLYRAKIQLGKNKKNGKQESKSGGGNAQDQYAARRGTNPGNHTSKDYGGPF